MIRNIKYIFYLIIPLCMVHTLFPNGPQPRLEKPQEHTKTDFEMQQELFNDFLRMFQPPKKNNDSKTHSPEGTAEDCPLFFTYLCNNTLTPAGTRLVETVVKSSPQFFKNLHEYALSPTLHEFGNSFSTQFRDKAICPGIVLAAALKYDTSKDFLSKDNLITVVVGTIAAGAFLYRIYTEQNEETNNKPKIQTPPAKRRTNQR